jgi:proline iminopeptidase
MPQSEVELQPPVREIRVPASDNVSLYVRVAGPAKSGPVLITIHGGPGMSSRYMLSLEQLAGPDLTVVSWDQRGANLSTSPPDESSCYSLPKYAKDLEAVRLAVGAETVHLLGHSWGGIVALQYAILYPDNVQSLILVNGGPPSWEELLRAQASLSMRIHALQQDGIMTTETPQSAAEALIAVLPAYFFDPSFQLPPNDLAGVINLSLAANQLTYEQLEDFDLTPDLAGLTMQVLILHGADDPFGGAMIDATREALANAEVKVIGLPDCGHFWQECPDDFYCAVRGFLSLSE